jgi:HTH-type transcriptional regulator/antitoxin HigA
MEIKPLKTDVDFRAALVEIETLWQAKPGSESGDRLEVLLMLVEAYEAKHHPMPPADPIDAILFMMDQRGLTRRDLEPLIGPRGRVAEVLNRKRPLTLGMIRRLSAELRIPAEILVTEYPVGDAA